MIALTLDEFREVYKNYILSEILTHVYDTCNKMSVAEWIISYYNTWFANNCSSFNDGTDNKEFFEKEKTVLAEKLNFPVDKIASLQQKAFKYTKDYDVQVYQRR